MNDNFVELVDQEISNPSNNQESTEPVTEAWMFEIYLVDLMEWYNIFMRQDSGVIKIIHITWYDCLRPFQPIIKVIAIVKS